MAIFPIIRNLGADRSRIVDAEQPTRVLALTEGHGISIGTPPEGMGRMAVEPIEVIDSPICRRCGRRSAVIVGPTGTGRCRSWRPRWPVPIGYRACRRT